MPTLADILTTSTSPAGFASDYLKRLSELLDSLDPVAIAEFAERLDRARRAEQTIFLIGNGGSAATASHMANDLGLCQVGPSQPAFRAFALTDAVPIVTAVANDLSYAEIFTLQLQIHYRPGDYLVAISASGNSPNVLSAASWVKDRGGTVLGLLGFDGGQLKELCDCAVIAHTPPGEYGPVEDVHLILNHILTLWLRRSLGGT
jgi:D-sedoheptulose 7-phosphate isomerase